MKNNHIIIIVGPTASGKSEAAIKLAHHLNGVIINSDSSQVYKEAPILTNSPNDFEKQQIPHHLYNFIGLEHNFKVTEWIELTNNIIKKELLNNRIPIIVGGNGFYINILINGITDIPEPSEKNKIIAEQTLKDLGIAKFREFLYTIDPEYAKSYCDPYRLVKSYSVYLETGQLFSIWQKKPKINKLKKNYIIIKIIPDRIDLYNKINYRFNIMLKTGALKEAENIFNSNINPIFYKKVIGLNELIDYINHKIALEKAIEIAAQKTRKYAKRQITWFKNQLKNSIIVNTNNVNLYKIISDKIIKN